MFPCGVCGHKFKHEHKMKIHSIKCKYKMIKNLVESLIEIEEIFLINTFLCSAKVGSPIRSVAGTLVYLPLIHLLPIKVIGVWKWMGKRVWL